MRVKAGILVGILAQAAYAGEVEDFVDHAAWQGEWQPMVRNMSTLEVDKAIFSYGRLSGNRNINLIGNRSDEASYSNKETYDTLGLFLPLGGASFGLDRTAYANDSAFVRNGDGSGREEQFRTTTYRGHFIVDLTSNLRGSFSYRYRSVNDHILGERFIRDNDRTLIKGSMTGYIMSFYYQGGEAGFGMHYGPAMRGKAEVEGEQKILSSPGSAGFRYNYQYSKSLTLGLAGVRWFYKKNDRKVMSTSPNDQSDISLDGIDFEQFLYNRDRADLSLRMELSPGMDLLLAGYRQDVTFMFDGDAVPGDNVERETQLRYHGYHGGLRIYNDVFFLQAGVHKAEREFGEIVDQNGKIYFRHNDYKAEEMFTFVSLGVKN